MKRDSILIQNHIIFLDCIEAISKQTTNGKYTLFIAYKGGSGDNYSSFEMGNSKQLDFVWELLRDKIIKPIVKINRYS